MVDNIPASLLVLGCKKQKLPDTFLRPLMDETLKWAGTTTLRCGGNWILLSSTTILRLVPLHLSVKLMMHCAIFGCALQDPFDDRMKFGVVHYFLRVSSTGRPVRRFRN
jgi:hypothetical protein